MTPPPLLTLAILALLPHLPACIDAHNGLRHILEDTRPSCKNVPSQESTVLLPNFAINTTAHEFERIKQMQTRNLRRWGGGFD